MVSVPVVTTLAIELPEIVPIAALEMTATFAGPPRRRPATEMQMSIKYLSAPTHWRNVPNARNPKSSVAAIPVSEPNIPSVVR